jgi:ribosomal protein S18 acetylase RimI-like enzyme
MDRSALLERIGLRPVTEADRELLIVLYGSTRTEELAQVAWGEGQLDAFVRMQFTAQDVHYRRVYPQATFDMVELDGVPAGRLYVDRRPEDIRVVDVAILPEQRGRGLGTALLTAVLEEAAASGRGVSIHVEVNNPAVRLYERLGFVAVAVADDGFYRRMEWAAP